MTPSDERRRARPDRGSGTLLVLIAATVLLLASVISIGIVATVATHRRAATAADLAALAGAGHRGNECAWAAQIARAHDVQLDRCQIFGPDVAVEMSAPLPGLLGSLAGDSSPGPRIRARARAGPA